MNATNQRFAKSFATKIFGTALLLTAAVSLPADAQPRQQSRQGYGWEGWERGRATALTSIDGTYVDQKYGCMLIRDHQGQIVPLVHNPGDLRRGDHVQLWGRVTANTSCGTAFRVSTVEKIWTDPAHRRTLYDRRRDGDYYARDRWDRDRYGYDDRYSSNDREGRDDNSRDGRYDNRRDGRYDGRDGRDDSSRDGRYDGREGRDDSSRDGRYDGSRDGRYDSRQDGRSDRSDRRAISVVGQIEAGRCTTLRAENGQVYGLSGELGRYGDGSRVRVIGILTGDSRCGGPEIEVGQLNGR
jgi:hypothetical protein